MKLHYSQTERVEIMDVLRVPMGRNHDGEIVAPHPAGILDTDGVSRRRIALLAVKALHRVIRHAVGAVIVPTEKLGHRLRCVFGRAVDTGHIEPLFGFVLIRVVADQTHHVGIDLDFGLVFIADVFEQLTEMTFYGPYFCDCQSEHLPSQTSRGSRRTDERPTPPRRGT